MRQGETGGGEDGCPGVGVQPEGWTKVGGAAEPMGEPTEEGGTGGVGAVSPGPYEIGGPVGVGHREAGREWPPLHATTRSCQSVRRARALAKRCPPTRASTSAGSARGRGSGTRTPVTRSPAPGAKSTRLGRDRERGREEVAIDWWCTQRRSSKERWAGAGRARSSSSGLPTIMGTPVPGESGGSSRPAGSGSVGRPPAGTRLAGC